LFLHWMRYYPMRIVQQKSSVCNGHVERQGYRDFHHDEFVDAPWRIAIYCRRNSALAIVRGNGIRSIYSTPT